MFCTFIVHIIFYRNIIYLRLSLLINTYIYLKHASVVVYDVQRSASSFEVAISFSRSAFHPHSSISFSTCSSMSPNIQQSVPSSKSPTNSLYPLRYLFILLLVTSVRAHTKRSAQTDRAFVIPKKSEIKHTHRDMYSLPVDQDSRHSWKQTRHHIYGPDLQTCSND